jgi:hypothetical protein
MDAEQAYVDLGRAEDWADETADGATPVTETDEFGSSEPDDQIELDAA